MGNNECSSKKNYPTGVCVKEKKENCTLVTYMTYWLSLLLYILYVKYIFGITRDYSLVLDVRLLAGVVNLIQSCLIYYVRVFKKIICRDQH